MKSKQQRDQEAVLGCLFLLAATLSIALLGFFCWAIYTVVTHYT